MQPTPVSGWVYHSNELYLELSWQSGERVCSLRGHTLRPAGTSDLLCRPGHEESLLCSPWGPKGYCTLVQKHDGTIGGTHREGVAFRDRDRSSHRACLGSAHRLRSLSRVESFYTSSKRASGARRAPRGTHATLRH